MAPVDGMAPETLEPLAREIDPGELPTRLRLLCVGSSEPSWVGLTLQLDARGCVEPNFNWVSTAGEALALLRDASFDCLLIRIAGERESSNDPLALARGIRAGGCGDPVVVVTQSADDETWCEALHLNVNLLVSSHGWETRALVPAIQRAVEHGQMLREIDRLSAADRRRLMRERDEADYLLRQQHEILITLERQARELAGHMLGKVAVTTTDQEAAPRSSKLPAEFDDYYQELVRTYVIMGSGTLVNEIAKLAELLAEAGLSPREVLDIHLARVGRLVRGLGNRSTRHVMARADLLALELMIHLGECYQRRHHLALNAARDDIPPGFSPAGEGAG